MSRRLEIELTSRREDGTWTWRAAGAKRPKGAVSAKLLPDTASVGSVLRVEADDGLDGLEIVSVCMPRARHGRDDRLKMIGAGQGPLVTTRLVSEGARSADAEERPGADGPARRGHQRRDDRSRDRDRRPRRRSQDDDSPQESRGDRDRSIRRQRRDRDDQRARSSDAVEQDARPDDGRSRTTPPGRGRGRGDTAPQGRGRDSQGRGRGGDAPQGRGRGGDAPQGRGRGGDAPQSRGRDSESHSRRGSRADAPEGSGQRDRQRDRDSRDRSDRLTGPRARMPTLKSRRVHRQAALKSLPPEQQPLAREVLRGGVPGVRKSIERMNLKADAEKLPRIKPDPILTLAESLAPVLKAAEWHDRAEAALAAISEIDLRDLRSLIAAADRSARSDETRALAESLRSGLAQRLEVDHRKWLDELAGTIHEGRTVRALRLSSRPPKAGTPLPPDMAERLANMAAADLNPSANQQRWATVVDSVALSPVRTQVVPHGIPETPTEELLVAIRRLADRVPQVAALFGIKPVPPRSARRPPPPPNKPTAAPAPAAAPASDGETRAPTAEVQTPTEVPAPPPADQAQAQTTAPAPPPADQAQAQTTAPAPTAPAPAAQT